MLWVGLGGFLGAIARHGLSKLIPRGVSGSLPLGTLCTNVLGCLLLGLIGSLLAQREGDQQTARQFLCVGLLGGFTTYSAFGLESFELMRNGEHGMVALYVGASLGLGIAAVWLGSLLARSLGG